MPPESVVLLLPVNNSTTSVAGGTFNRKKLANHVESTLDTILPGLLNASGNNNWSAGGRPQQNWLPITTDQFGQSWMLGAQPAITQNWWPGVQVAGQGGITSTAQDWSSFWDLTAGGNNTWATSSTAQANTATQETIRTSSGNAWSDILNNWLPGGGTEVAETTSVETTAVAEEAPPAVEQEVAPVAEQTPPVTVPPQAATAPAEPVNIMGQTAAEDAKDRILVKAFKDHLTADFGEHFTTDFENLYGNRNGTPGNPNMGDKEVEQAVIDLKGDAWENTAAQAFLTEQQEDILEANGVNPEEATNEQLNTLLGFTLPI